MKKNSLPHVAVSELGTTIGFLILARVSFFVLNASTRWRKMKRIKPTIAEQEKSHKMRERLIRKANKECFPFAEEFCKKRGWRIYQDLSDWYNIETDCGILYEFTITCGNVSVSKQGQQLLIPTVRLREAGMKEKWWLICEFVCKVARDYDKFKKRTDGGYGND